MQPCISKWGETPPTHVPGRLLECVRTVRAPPAPRPSPAGTRPARWRASASPPRCRSTSDAAGRSRHDAPRQQQHSGQLSAALPPPASTHKIKFAGRSRLRRTYKILRLRSGTTIRKGSAKQVRRQNTAYNAVYRPHPTSAVRRRKQPKCPTQRKSAKRSPKHSEHFPARLSLTFSPDGEDI